MLWDRKVLIFDRFCKFWTGHFLWEENNMNNLCFHCNPPRSPPQGIVAEEIAGLGEQGTKGLQWHTEGMEGRTDAFFRVTHGDTYRVAWKWLLPICLDSGLWFETIGRADVLLFQHRWDVYTCQRGGTLRCHFFRQVLEHLCWSQSHLEIVGLPAFALRRALAGPSDPLDSLRKMTFLLLDVSALSCGKNMELLWNMAGTFPTLQMLAGVYRPIGCIGVLQ